MDTVGWGKTGSRQRQTRLKSSVISENSHLLRFGRSGLGLGRGIFGKNLKGGKA